MLRRTVSGGMTAERQYQWMLRREEKKALGEGGVIVGEALGFLGLLSSWPGRVQARLVWPVELCWWPAPKVTRWERTVSL